MGQSGRAVLGACLKIHESCVAGSACTVRSCKAPPTSGTLKVAPEAPVEQLSG